MAQAVAKNVGTCPSMLREKSKRKTRKDESTNAEGGAEWPVVVRKLRNRSGAKGPCYPVLNKGQPKGRSQ
jgi:hypothetical protein